MTHPAERIAAAHIPDNSVLAGVLETAVAQKGPHGVWTESREAREVRRVAMRAFGRFISRLITKLANKVLQRVPDTANLIEMGTGLDPLEWIHNAGPGTGTYDVIVQCTGETQRANVEAQLDSAGIAHTRPPPTALEWWNDTGSTQFPGATEATWEIAEAYADTQSDQLERAIQTAARADAFRTFVESMAAGYGARDNEAQAD